MLRKRKAGARCFGLFLFHPGIKPVWMPVGAGSVAYDAQVARSWGDNNPLIFRAPLANSLL